MRCSLFYVHSFSPSTAFIILPSEPSPVQISDTQRHALQTKMHRYFHKSRLYTTLKLQNNLLELEAVGFLFCFQKHVRGGLVCIYVRLRPNELMKQVARLSCGSDLAQLYFLSTLYTVFLLIYSNTSFTIKFTLSFLPC